MTGMVIMRATRLLPNKAEADANAPLAVTPTEQAAHTPVHQPVALLAHLFNGGLLVVVKIIVT